MSTISMSLTRRCLHRTAGPAVTAVHVSDSREEIAALSQAWRGQYKSHPFLAHIRLRHIVSPYRTLIPALMGYMDDLSERQPGATITVVLPELVPAHWWEQPLHTQTALRMKAALLFRPGTVVISVPFHLERQPEQSSDASSAYAGSERPAR